MAGDFKKLKIWEYAHNRTLEVYKITKGFPDDERYGLVSQMRRAMVSVPANIVEGFKRKSGKDFLHFLNISESSLEEVKYYFILSCDLKYINKIKSLEFIKKLEELSRMINGFKNVIKNRLRKGVK